MTRPRDRARSVLAKAIERRGPAWRNAASSVRSGYENVWITPALDALEAVLRLCPDEGEDDTEAGRA